MISSIDELGELFKQENGRVSYRRFELVAEKFEYSFFDNCATPEKTDIIYYLNELIQLNGSIGYIYSNNIEPTFYKIECKFEKNEFRNGFLTISSIHQKREELNEHFTCGIVKSLIQELECPSIIVDLYGKIIFSNSKFNDKRNLLDRKFKELIDSSNWRESVLNLISEKVDRISFRGELFHIIVSSIKTEGIETISLLVKFELNTSPEEARSKQPNYDGFEGHRTHYFLFNRDLRLIDSSVSDKSIDKFNSILGSEINLTDELTKKLKDFIEFGQKSKSIWINSDHKKLKFELHLTDEFILVKFRIRELQVEGYFD